MFLWSNVWRKLVFQILWANKKISARSVKQQQPQCRVSKWYWKVSSQEFRSRGLHNLRLSILSHRSLLKRYNSYLRHAKFHWIVESRFLKNTLSLLLLQIIGICRSMICLAHHSRRSSKSILKKRTFKSCKARSKKEMHRIWAWLLFLLAHLWKVSKTTIHHQCLPVLGLTLIIFDSLLPCWLSNQEVPSWLTQIPIRLIFYVCRTLIDHQFSRIDS